MSFYIYIQHFRNDHHPSLTITVSQNKRLHTKIRLKLFIERCQNRISGGLNFKICRGHAPGPPLETPAFAGRSLAFGTRATP